MAFSNGVCRLFAPASQLPLSLETRASCQSLPLKGQEVPTAPQGAPRWLRKEALSPVRGRARAWEEPPAWVPKPRVKRLLKYQRLHVCQAPSSGFSKHISVSLQQPILQSTKPRLRGRVSNAPGGLRVGRECHTAKLMEPGF